jgi:predicted outer membrane repeat protein
MSQIASHQNRPHDRWGIIPTIIPRLSFLPGKARIHQLLVYGLFLFLIGSWLAPRVVHAERYHVRTSGLRASGVSIPEDWTSANCYDSIATALSQAAPADTVLLFKEDHTVSVGHELPATLANQDLDNARAECRVIMEPSAYFYFNSQGAEFTVQGITFTRATSQSYPPAFWLDNSNENIQEIRFEDCLFRNHHGSIVPYGGSCIHGQIPGHNLHLTLRNCLFRDNTAPGPGGAVFIGDNYQVDIEDCQFINNASLLGSEIPARGGALSMKSLITPTTVVMSHCLIDSNRSEGPGGGLAMEDGHLTMFDCDVTNNRSAYSGERSWAAGAGLLFRHNNDSGEHTQTLMLDVLQCRFIGNQGNLSLGFLAADGGGILARGTDSDHRVELQIAETLLENNFNSQGSGIYVGRFAEGRIQRTSFISNTAFLNGGAVYKGGDSGDNLGDTATFEYCDFIGNQAGYDVTGQQTDHDGRGGAFMERLYPRAEFLNCSFSNNRCGGSTPKGDAIYNWDEGIGFTDPLQRSILVNCSFYGTNGLDKQINSDPDGFTAVSHCAYSEGEYFCYGVNPIESVILTDSPYITPDDLKLHDLSACIDQGLFVGITPDINGIEVPQGLATDVGAHEYEEPEAIWLQSFFAVPDQRGVNLVWQTAGSNGSVFFRVTGSVGSTQWDVAYVETAPGNYQARDEAAPLANGGVFTYTLWGREPGQTWFELGRTTVEKAAIPNQIRLLTAYPNPFNPRTNVRFEVSRTTHLTLSLYDPSGRLVTVLAEGIFPSGIQEVEWNGLDSHGHSVAAGVYYVRLENSTHSESCKLTLVR